MRKGRYKLSWTWRKFTGRVQFTAVPGLVRLAVTLGQRGGHPVEELLGEHRRLLPARPVHYRLPAEQSNKTV